MKLKKTKIGTIISIDIQQISNLLPSMGFDFLLIDLEHGKVADETILSIIRSNNNNCQMLIRIAEITEAKIKHALDLGCDGIVAPRVEYADELKTLIDYSYYPPRGKRSVGFCPANKFGHAFNEYTNSFQPLILAQVESVKGLEIAQQIAEFDRISGILIGPYDLSMSLGVPGLFHSKTFREPYNSIKKICNENNKLFCTFTSDADSAKAEIENDIDMIAVGVDSNLIVSTYSQLLGSLEIDKSSSK